MIFDTWYVKGPSLGPRFPLEAEDADHARDIYILEVWPTVWQDHWALRRDHGMDSHEYHSLYQNVQAIPRVVSEGERRKGGLHLVKGNQIPLDTPAEKEQTTPSSPPVRSPEEGGREERSRELDLPLPFPDGIIERRSPSPHPRVGGRERRAEPPDKVKG